MAVLSPRGKAASTPKAGELLPGPETLLSQAMTRESPSKRDHALDAGAGPYGQGRIDYDSSRR